MNIKDLTIATKMVTGYSAALIIVTLISTIICLVIYF